MKNKIVFILILLTAFFIRIFSINWDQGFHLHPDERMLIMVAGRINFFTQLNPDFFNYGSLPIYILKGSAQVLDHLFKTSFSNYDGMLYLGRYISVFSDLLVIFLIYKIVFILDFALLRSNNLLGANSKNSSKTIAILACFFYSIAFFPIQNSHFFVVDVFLNLFTTLLIYQLLIFIKLPSYNRIIIIGVVFAAMMATKFTAILFLPIILVIIFIITIKQLNKFFTKIKLFLINLFIFVSTLIIFYFFFMPYAFLNFNRFLKDILEQTRMNSNPYIFPYTLQYVYTTPYVYYLKNIFIWGLGPIISLLSFIGFLSLAKFSIFNFQFSIKSKFSNFKLLILFFFFYLFYFLIIGHSAVKFMRYMLLLYPFFAILAGYGLYRIYILKNKMSRILTFAFLLLTLLWSYMFVNIFSQKHSRIAATEWILANIPPKSSITNEHWDDGMPLYGGEKYNRIELPLYELPDDENKWINIINPKIQQADYIIISSNRLYTPLQKLADCKKYKVCYPKTAEYYKKLFSGQLGYKKVAEFSSYPYLKIGPPIGGWKLEINDDSSDESFTVYDHPKIIIFEKKR